VAAADTAETRDGDGLQVHSRRRASSHRTLLHLRALITICAERGGKIGIAQERRYQ
jgi:hypothetical protein